MRQSYRNTLVPLMPGLFADVDAPEAVNIGRRGRIRPECYDPIRHGTSGREPFTVIALQRDWRGETCYRVVHDWEREAFGLDGAFGRPLRFADVEFIDHPATNEA